MSTVAERVIEAFNAYDLDALAQCYTPDATVWPTGWPEAVPASEWLSMVPMLRESFPILHLAIRRVLTHSSGEAVELVMEATNLGPLHLNDSDRRLLGTDAASLPPTGRTMTIDGVILLDVESGLVTAERHYWLYADSLTQLGVAGPTEALNG